MGYLLTNACGVSSFACNIRNWTARSLTRTLKHNHWDAEALARDVVVNPVLAPGDKYQLLAPLGFHMQSVQPWRGRRWAEAHYIVVGYVVRQCDETSPQTPGIVEVMELASGELRDGFCGIGSQCVT